MKDKPTTLRESARNLFYSLKDDANHDEEDISKIVDFLTSHNTELISKIEGLKKQKTSPRQLIRNDLTVEHIMYYENDSDPAFNQALDEVINIIKNR